MNNNLQCKILVSFSLVVNILLIGYIFFNLPSKQDREMINFFDQATKSVKKISNKEIKEIELVANNMVEKISQEWKIEVFKSYFSPKALKFGSDETVQKTIKMYSKLGKLKNKPSTTAVESLINQPTYRSFSANFIFDKGEAYIRLVLEKKDVSWKLINLNITSKVFLNH
ncbi:MAG: Unknown protein [uncultured Campylobacterales bacterium]|uniref:Uncharacterized protein n=1 Tax=uncultured Campylobacterales bacterium TaxID=352960 RepID=A0A6S6S4E0_9BACT|nr:MAG: Unknown protein [uncultured Campylobacterales bacterium]